jgi:hypothetical protein
MVAIVASKIGQYERACWENIEGLFCSWKEKVAHFSNNFNETCVLEIMEI